MVVPTVPVAAGLDRHRPAGDRDPLAPTRLPRLLALEVPPPRRPSANRLRDSSADSAHEPREPTVGRTSYPRRTVDAWDRGRGIDGRQVYGPAPASTVARLEDLPAQSRRWDRFAGSVRSTHDLVQAALRPGDSASRPQATPRDCGDGQSDRPVDRGSGD